MIKLTTNQPARASKPTVKAKCLSHLLFERPDLDRAEGFLKAFGLSVAERRSDAIFLRGVDAGAYCYVIRRAARSRFVGFGLGVDSEADLAALAALPMAGGIGALDAPSGGRVVRLTDPSGFVVEAVHGQAFATALPRREPLAINTFVEQRRINATQRLPLSPPEVLRLGHAVIEVAQFQATCAFYTEHFGMIPSDVQVLPDGSPAVVFLRLDRGDTPTDHHTLAIAQGFAPRYGHSAFEVVDADAVAMGERVLREAGYRHAWGVGRHILGSQVFDYWYDPDGDKHEHYSDGDLFTSDLEMGVHEVSRAAMAQWGPPMPASFTRPKLSAATVIDAMNGLRTSPDLTLGKLRTLQKIFG